MKSALQLKPTAPLLLIALVLLCFAFSPGAQAVVPPPDGGYPGGNTAEGQAALLSLTSGTFNTAVGFASLRADSTGNFNTGVGAGTLPANTAAENTATGAAALLANTTGTQNTANGAFALFSNTAGNFNTAVGDAALSSSTGDGNIGIGFAAGAFVGSSGNVIAIGSPGDDVDNSCFIGNIRDIQTQNADAIAVVVDSAGQLGTVSSSRRFKKQVKAMDKASEAILAFKPVTFHYKSDKTGTAQFGLIAEEVAAINPDLVMRDKKGEIYTVRYDAVNAMLLNEFLKEHRRVEEVKSAMAQQRKDFEVAIVQQQKTSEALVARLNEQEARIQKVSAQAEMRKPGSQMLVENQ
jgi:hypothetical protein